MKRRFKTTWKSQSTSNVKKNSSYMQATINYGRLLAYGMWRSVACYRLATAWEGATLLP